MPLQPQQQQPQQQQQQPQQQMQEYSQPAAANDVYNSDYSSFGMRNGQQQQQQQQNNWGSLSADDLGANPYGQPPPPNHTMAAAAMGMLPPQG